MSESAAFQAIRNKRLVFLVGSPRSGTTWLQLLLSSSPSVATGRETHLFSDYTTSLFSAWRGDQRFFHEHGLKTLMHEEEFLGLVRELASQVMARILQIKPEASVILEKSPGHARYAHDILAIYPEAHFLHIVRDPRAVVASLQAARTWASDWASSRLTDNCEMWQSHVEQARAIRSATPHYYEVRYEDLLAHGVDSLQRIFLWMGVDAEKQDCANIYEANRIANLRNKFDNWPVDFFRRGEVDAWRQELTAPQIQLIERRTRQLALELGYEPVSESGFNANQVIVAWLLAAERIRSGLRWRVRRFVDNQ